MKEFFYPLMIACVLCAAPLFAEVEVVLDNDHIQEFRGNTGKWMQVANKNQLKSLCDQFSTGIERVLRVNGADSERALFGKPVFIPYSREYTSRLESEGKSRNVIQCREHQFIWPVNGVSQLTSVFGLRWGELHEGLDMPCPRGTIIRAAKSGKVIGAGYAGGYGREILIEHRDNYVTRYAHNSVNYVKEGDFVVQGQVIALVGSSGNSTGSHLHFEIRSNGIPLDPLDLLPQNERLDTGNLRLKNWR